MLFRDDDPRPAHLSHTGVDGFIVGLGIAAPAHFAPLGHQALVARPVARQIAQISCSSASTAILRAPLIGDRACRALAWR